MSNLRIYQTRRECASRLHPFGINYMRVAQTRNCGFTLIEILVALAIIAIALAALIKASGNHTYSASYLKQKTLAHYVAMNEFALLQIEKKWPDIGEEKKSTEMADHEWHWTRKVEKMVDPTTGKPSNQFIQVSFTVYLDEDRKQNLTRLTGYISNIAAAGTSQQEDSNP